MYNKNAKKLAKIADTLTPFLKLPYEKKFT